MNIGVGNLGQNNTSNAGPTFWIYENPTTVKVLEVAGVILGLSMLAATPFIGTGAAILLGMTGSLLTLASAVALYVLDLLVPPHHEMKTHAFKPAQCEGGRLYYEGDTPILTLESDDPFIAGKAHGYLCGDAINRLSKRMELAMHTLAGRPKAEELPKTLAAIRETIPAEYIREMEGLLDGYNQWSREASWIEFPKVLTLEDLLLLHIIPDSLHFNPMEYEGREPVQDILPAVACTSIVDRNEQGDFVFARNMDWPSFGLAGTYSLIINRKHANGTPNTIEVGLPGMVGTLTGMNSHGLSIAMNVCAGRTELRGMPAVFYNRACLEKCRDAPEVSLFVIQNSPLGPYHLTISDEERARSIHFHQGPHGHTIRTWVEDDPLVTLNFRYQPHPVQPVHHCQERQNEIDQFFENRAGRPLEDALALPHVNNGITTHRVLMEPRTRTFKVAFDNAYAGNAPLQDIPTAQLLA